MYKKNLKKSTYINNASYILWAALMYRTAHENIVATSKDELLHLHTCTFFFKYNMSEQYCLYNFFENIETAHTF